MEGGEGEDRKSVLIECVAQSGAAHAPDLNPSKSECGSACAAPVRH